MVRKQVYLEQGQERKLKALAALRGCTEAQVIREAVDRLPDPAGSLAEQLASVGLLAPKRFDPDAPNPEELQELEAEHEAWLSSLSEPLDLAEAVIADREGR
jgi:hypothetical protein